MDVKVSPVSAAPNGSGSLRLKADAAYDHPNALDVRRVGRLRCRHSWDFQELRDLRQLADDYGRRDLVHALNKAMRRSDLRARANTILRFMAGLQPRRRGHGS